MNRDDLLRKLRNDQPLTSAEEAWLEDALAADAQVPALMKDALTDDVPSMAWRSELNEKLLASAPPAPRPKLSLMKWLTGGSLTVGLAASVALVLIWQNKAVVPTTSVSKPTTIEAALVAAHQDGMSQIEFSAPSTADSSPAKTTQEEFQWSDADLDSL